MSRMSIGKKVKSQSCPSFSQNSPQQSRMSEYWVSRKTWTCKYCNLTINDDAPSRLQHENGMRHKGNVERALKDVYRKSENERREKSIQQTEMRKINKVSIQYMIVSNNVELEKRRRGERKWLSQRV